jgi:hypothetical protein
MHGQRRRGDKPGPVRSSPLGAGQKHSTSLCLSVSLSVCLSLSLSLSLFPSALPLSLPTSVPNAPLGADQEDRKQHARTHILVPSVPVGVGQLDMVFRHVVAPDLPDVRALDRPLRCICCACVTEEGKRGEGTHAHTHTQISAKHVSRTHTRTRTQACRQTRHAGR